MHVTTIDRGDTLNHRAHSPCRTAARQAAPWVTHEIAFIDPGVSDIGALLSGMRPGVESVLLNASSAAILQIARALRNRSALSAIHIIAHGAPGEVSFSAGRLDSEALRGQTATLLAIGRALKSNGKLLLWTCNTGSGEPGLAFVKRLSELAGVDVAAADGLIGDSALGGAWHLNEANVAAPLTTSGMDAYHGLMAASSTYTWVGPSSGTYGGEWDNGIWKSGTTSGSISSKSFGPNTASEAAVISSGGTVQLDNADVPLTIYSLTNGGTINFYDPFQTASFSMTLAGSGTVLSNTGTINIAGGVLSVSGSGILSNVSGGVISLSGGTLNDGSGSTVNSGTISGFGTLNDTLGGTGSVVASGGILNLSGGSLTGTNQFGIVGAATLEFSESATIVGTTNSLGSGQILETGSGGNLTLTGTEIVGSGGTLNGVVGTGLTVSSVTVMAGGKTSGVYVTGTESLSGSSFDDTITGTQMIYGGGLATSAQVQLGGTEFVLAGGTTVSATVYGSETVAVGATTSAANVTLSGRDTVYGSSINDIVGNGGIETIESNASATGTTIQGNGELLVLSAGRSTSAVVSGGTGGLDADLNVSGTSVSATLDAFGSETVYTGGVASATTVNSGGTLVLSGTATDTGLVLNSGGTLVVGGGFTLTSATLPGLTVSTGRTLAVESGGTASGVTVSSGGTIVFSGGNTGGLTLKTGAFEVVASGVTMSALTVAAGVTETVSAGGIQSSASVLGTENVYGSTVGDTVSAGATQTVYGGGVAIGTTLSGGTETVSSGGTTSNETIASGGNETVLAGGTTTSDLITNAGSLTLSSGSIASGFTVNSGGTLNLVASATASAVTVNSLGKVDTDLTYTSSTTNNHGTSTTITESATVGSGGQLDLVTTTTISSVHGVSSTTTTAGTGVYLTSALSGGGTFTVANDGTGNAIFTETAACYLRGTHILTDTGERPVEALQIGDRVMTRFGGLQRVKWIGRHAYRADFARHNREVIPVQIRAGALGEGLPARDLYVSPGHSMLINDALVLAKSLVNGVTVKQSELPGIYDYFQPELDSHDCVVAEGAWSETFADGPGLRDKFQNHAEFDQLFPDHRAPDALIPLCAHRPERGASLAAALTPVVERASAGIAPGALRGFIDRVDGEWKLDGWAQDVEHPDLPVMLEVLVEGKVIGAVLACDFRQDLFDVFGHGNSSFVFESPVRLTPERLRTLEVRRARDGALVQVNENIRPSAALVQSQALGPELETRQQRVA